MDNTQKQEIQIPAFQELLSMEHMLAKQMEDRWGKNDPETQEISSLLKYVLKKQQAYFETVVRLAEKDVPLAEAYQTAEQELITGKKQDKDQ